MCWRARCPPSLAAAPRPEKESLPEGTPRTTARGPAVGPSPPSDPQPERAPMACVSGWCRNGTEGLKLWGTDRGLGSWSRGTWRPAGQGLCDGPAPGHHARPGERSAGPSLSPRAPSYPMSSGVWLLPKGRGAARALGCGGARQGDVCCVASAPGIPTPASADPGGFAELNYVGVEWTEPGQGTGS